MNTKVLNDRTTYVERDHTEIIGQNQYLRVKEDRYIEISGNSENTLGRYAMVHMVH